MKLIPNTEIKYLGLIFDEHLSWLPQIQNLNAKLNRATNQLSKCRHYIPQPLLLQLYYGQFYSHLLYGCQLWGQELNENSQTFILQKKVIRKITFSDLTDHTSPLFKELNVLKLMDIINMSNFLFVHNALNKKLPKVFEDYFKQIEIQTEYSTRNEPKSSYSIPNGSVELPNIKNKTTGKNNIQYQSSIIWNELLKTLTSTRNATQTALNKKEFHEQDTNWLTKLKLYEVKKVQRLTLLATTNVTRLLTLCTTYLLSLPIFILFFLLHPLPLYTLSHPCTLTHTKQAHTLNGLNDNTSK